MIYFLSLIPATGLVIGGYLVFYLVARSEGTFRTFGKYLGFWAFTLAGLVILGAIFAAAHRGNRGPMMMRPGAYGRMNRPFPGPPFFGPGMGPGGPRMGRGMGPGRPDRRFGAGQPPPPPGGPPPQGPTNGPKSSASSSAAPSPTQ